MAKGTLQIAYDKLLLENLSLEADLKIKQSVCETIEREVTKINKALKKRTKELETEIQEVSNQLLGLYDNCNETTRPAVYGTILGLHERLEQALALALG
jgi:hypothetical protein